MFKRNLLLSFLVFCFLAMPLAACADDGIYSFIDEKNPYDYKLWERNGKFEQKVYEVGFNLLNANKFQRNVYFYVKKTTKEPNAYARYFDGNITVYSSIFPYIENDDELAALLAHELSHINQLSKGFWPWKRVKMHFAPKYYEHDADLKGVDMMVKAGYNPLAMITFFNKFSPEYSALMKVCLVLFSFANFTNHYTHPTGSTRMAKVYNHILVNYPQFITQGYDNPYYTNFLINAEKDPNIRAIKDEYDL